MKSFVAFSLLFAVAFATEWVDPEHTAFDGIENRIVGGEFATPAQFPFQVRLHFTKRVSGRLVNSLCGGSIISDKVILTAAHCVLRAISATAFLGVTNINSVEPLRVAIQLGPKNFIIHENYNKLPFKDDIALIILPAAVRFNSAIQPIRLPRASLTNLDNVPGIISGFGRTGDRQGPSPALKFVQRDILPSSRCQLSFGPTFRPPTNICVDGSLKKSACPGDSGGPLTITEADGIKTLVGLTSFGKMSCEIGSPAAYTRITAYLNWINKHTGIPVSY